jgi:hypothetical protein
MEQRLALTANIRFPIISDVSRWFFIVSVNGKAT